MAVGEATALLAVWGAVLSSVAIIWNILRDTKDKGKLKLDAMIGKFYPDHTDKEYLVVTMTNVGRRPLLVKGWGGKEKGVPGGKKQYDYIIPVGLPRMLKEGEYHVEVTPDLGILSSELEYICAWDSAGKEWKVSQKKLEELVDSAKKRRAERDAKKKKNTSS